MFLTTSTIARKSGEPCTQEDFESVIPALASRDAFVDLVQQYQSQGKIVYRSFSVQGDGSIETVTLYQSESDHDQFKAEPAQVAFANDILQVYNQTNFVTDNV